jgi:putative membrane-bound dehydrogenase-like protein
MKHCMRILVALLCAGFAQAAPVKVLISSDLPEVARAAWTGSPAVVSWTTQPTAQDLAKVDVFVLHRAKPDQLTAPAQQAIAEFVKRGGGIVVLGHGLACGDSAWGKLIAGAGWGAESRSLAGLHILCFRTDAHALTKDVADFNLKDAIFYDLEFADKVDVLCSAFTPKLGKNSKAVAEDVSIYDIQPQLWVRESGKQRSVVFAQSSANALNHLSYRALLKRAVAWVAHQEAVDSLCLKPELADLRYPAGGPRRAEQTVAAIKLPAGFKTTVVATEPLVHKPIAVQWDAAGRMWVAETPEYPNGRRPLVAESWKEGGSLVPDVYDRPAQDTLSILYDDNGDGVMDRREVFFDGLELITGFCLHRDGAIVVSQGGISWLRDTNGDGKADVREEIFEGFTPTDTHFVTNHLIQAPDGWIYASTGSGTVARQPKTRKEIGRVSPGIFRFRPDGSAIEQIASQGGNSFGAEVTTDMEVFHSKATTGNPVQHAVIPEATLARNAGTSTQASHAVNPGRKVVRADRPTRAPFVQVDLVGLFTAACSTLVCEEPNWPSEYQRNVFLTEPILDVIQRELLVPEGPSYRGDPGPQGGAWLRSEDEWFMPITLAFAPDGSMVVLDFYSPVVLHNDTRGPLHSRSNAAVRPDREHHYGRIYRITPPNNTPLKVPDLTQAGAPDLLAALNHPSRTVRANAQRLLHEKFAKADETILVALRKTASEPAEAPAILALWSLARFGEIKDSDLSLSATRSAGLRRNVFLIAESLHRALPLDVIRQGLQDADERVQLAALRALGAAPMSPESAALLLEIQPTLKNAWASAAASAAGSEQPGVMFLGLLTTNRTDPESLNFAQRLAASLSAKDEATLTNLLGRLAGKDVAPKLAETILKSLSQLPAPERMDARLLEALLTSADFQRAVQAAPLVRRWTTPEQFKDAKHALAVRLGAENALVDEAHAAALAALAGLDVAADRKLTDALTHQAQEKAGMAALAVLKGAGDEATTARLISLLSNMSGGRRDVAMEILLSRPSASQQLLVALASRKISALQFSPYHRSRLTGHPDAAVAREAVLVFKKLEGASSPGKDELIARFLPQMAGPADVEEGRTIFRQACALCHQLENVGNVVGPNLNGIGSHAAGDLLIHIIDPNRTVDDEHRAWSFEMRSGTQLVGLIAAENTAGVTLKLPGGTLMPLAAADIVKREPRTASLMPEGYEALGENSLRNMLAYLKALSVPAASGTQVGRYFYVDLSRVATADSREGIYMARDKVAETLRFKKFGDLKGNGIPFRVIDPSTSAEHRNLIVLRGGPSDAYARSFAPSVDIPVGIAAYRLHVLGGVGGWASVGNGKTPAMTVDIMHVDGTKQSVTWMADKDFADYISPNYEAKGSRRADGLLASGQVRTLAVDIASRAPIQSITLRSHDNTVVPTTAAITLELEAPTTELAQPKTAFAPKKLGQLRVLLAGSGGSHDFEKYFLGQDGDTLRATKRMEVIGVADADEAARLLPEADVLVLSANRKDFGDELFQKALTAFANSGKGVIILHAATWYNWKSVPGYNERFVGGGTKSHGLGDVTVNLTGKAHPIVAGLSGKSFTFHDESYHIELTPTSGALILAENSPDKVTKRKHPSVWIMPDAKARIVCISLGHDAPAHSSPDYQRLLVNAVDWVGSR